MKNEPATGASGEAADGPREPTLRERQAQQVRDGLRGAFIRLVAERGPHGFTLQDVARAAGVSDRTLYRYYPSRDALVGAVREIDVGAFDAELARRQLRPARLGEDPELIAKTFELFEEHAPLVRAARLLRTAGLDNVASYARTDNLKQSVASDRRLHPDRRDQLAGLVRTLTSSDTWERMREPDIGLSPREAGHAVQWAVRVLMREARRAGGPLRALTDDQAGADAMAGEDGDGDE